MSDLQLSLHATADEIAEAIRKVQARCRSGLAHPERMARSVHDQVALADRMALAIGRSLKDLDPRMEFWPSDYSWNGTTTVIRILYAGIYIGRRGPSQATWNGSLSLTLKLPKDTP